MRWPGPACSCCEGAVRTRPGHSASPATHGRRWCSSSRPRRSCSTRSGRVRSARCSGSASWHSVCPPTAPGGGPTHGRPTGERLQVPAPAGVAGRGHRARRRGELGASGRPVRASRRSGHGPPRGSRGHLPRRPAAPRRPLAGARRPPPKPGRRAGGLLFLPSFLRRGCRGGGARGPAAGGGVGGWARRGARRPAAGAPGGGGSGPRGAPRPSRGTVLVVVLAAFAGLVVGVLRYRWGFDEMAALFFVMGVVAGLCGGLGVGGTAAAFVDGFRAMAYAALLIGFARAIYVALDQGRIADTIVRGLFTPAAGLPLALSALGMLLLHAAVHGAVPSPSGHAVLTLPILVPLSDLLGLSRQVTVLAYQYGGGLCELLTPTNGALMAILAAAGVRYEHWLKFALPLYGTLLGLRAVAVAPALALGLR